MTPSVKEHIYRFQILTNFFTTEHVTNIMRMNTETERENAGIIFLYLSSKLLTSWVGLLYYFWEVFCTIDVVLESVNHQGSNVSQVVACQKWTYREYMK